MFPTPPPYFGMYLLRVAAAKAAQVDQVNAK